MISTPGSGRTFAIAFTEGGLYRFRRVGGLLAFELDRYHMDNAVAYIL